MFNRYQVSQPKKFVAQVVEDDDSDQDIEQKQIKDTQKTSKNEEQKFQSPSEFDLDIDYEQHQDSEIYLKPIPPPPIKQEIKINPRQPNPKVVRRGIISTDLPVTIRISPNPPLKLQQESFQQEPAKQQEPIKLDVQEAELNPDLIKRIFAQRLRHGRYQFLYEKNSGSKAWKDYALLQSKGYGKECVKFMQFLDHRIYASILSQIIYLDRSLIYTRRHTIQQGKIIAFDEVQYKGKEYPKQFSEFDKKMQRKICKQMEQRKERVEIVLDYHNLQLNLNLRPVILILSCDKTEKGIFCKYIQCGKEFKCDMDEIEQKYPKELAFFLNDQIKKVQSKKK